MRQEARKLDKRMEQYKLLCDYNLDSPRELVSFISKKETDISQLKDERQKLYNKCRREDNPQIKESYYRQAKEISAKIKPLRKQIKTAKEIIQQTPELERLLKTERDMEIQAINRERERER